MSNIIKDGTGKCNLAKVDNTFRLHTRAVTVSAAEEALIGGESFRISTAVITLTSANESHLLYLKNNDKRDMFISEIIQVLGASTGGTGDYKSGFVLNPTGGTIVSDETALTIINQNVGSSITASAIAYTGAEGKTATGVSASTLYPEKGRFTVQDAVIIPKGSDMSLSITPPTSNTSMQAQIVIKFYFIEEV